MGKDTLGAVSQCGDNAILDAVWLCGKYRLSVDAICCALSSQSDYKATDRFVPGEEPEGD